MMNTRRTTSSLAAATLALSLPLASPAASPAAKPADVAGYEAQVKRFKPANGLAAPNTNDLRRFVYEWFNHFEHASPPNYYLGHLDDRNMSLEFPGTAPLTSHADFSRWYANLLAQTTWNFHDVSALQIEQIAAQEYRLSFVVDWYGEVKADSDQRAGWQSRGDSNLYHHHVRQTWTVKAGDPLVIEKLVVTGGDTPSPINE